MPTPEELERLDLPAGEPVMVLHRTTFTKDNCVISTLVGDTQRISLYAEQGFAVSQDVPTNVSKVYQRLVAAGYTQRLIV